MYPTLFISIKFKVSLKFIRYYSRRMKGLELQVGTISLSLTSTFTVLFYKRKRMPFKFKVKITITVMIYNYLYTKKLTLLSK